MAVAIQTRRNVAPWWALFFAILAVGSNFVLFVGIRQQAAMPWLSIAFAIVALFLVGSGLIKTFGRSGVYGGRVLTVIVSFFVLIVVGMTAFVSIRMRELPSAASAPQVGQRAPDFSLQDTSGKVVTLHQLLVPASGSSTTAPKAVLLVFYRGYW